MLMIITKHIRNLTLLAISIFMVSGSLKAQYITAPPYTSYQWFFSARNGANTGTSTLALTMPPAGTDAIVFTDGSHRDANGILTRVPRFLRFGDGIIRHTDISTGNDYIQFDPEYVPPAVQSSLDGIASDTTEALAALSTDVDTRITNAIAGIVLTQGPPGKNGINGRDGVDGLAGVDGAPGQSAFDIALDNGFLGTTSEWLASLKGEPGEDGHKGDKGEKGNDGSPGAPGSIGGAGPAGRDGTDGSSASVTIGSITTLSPGASATATNSGTSQNVVLNLGIPRGAGGANGKSSYELAQDAGFSGTLAQFQDSLKGAAGNAATITIGAVTTGAPGSSVVVTNVGTSQNAVLNITIPRGSPGTNGTDGSNGSNGTPGAPGAAATLTVGSVTTTAAGTNAEVTNTGTTNAAVLAIKIPRGADGAAGTPGAPGAPGSPGVVTATAPLSYNSGTQTISFSPTINDAPNRTYVTSATATGWQVSASRPAEVSYNAQIATAIGLTGNVTGDIVLETCPTNSTTAADWIIRDRLRNRQDLTVAIGLNIGQTIGKNLSCWVKPGHFVRVRSIGTGVTFVVDTTIQQETTL